GRTGRGLAGESEQGLALPAGGSWRAAEDRAELPSAAKKFPPRAEPRSVRHPERAKRRSQKLKLVKQKDHLDGSPQPASCHAAGSRPPDGRAPAARGPAAGP